MKKLSILGLSLIGSLIMATSVPAFADLTIHEPKVVISETNKTAKTNIDQVPSDESLIKLLKVMRMDEMMTSMSGTQKDMIGPIMEQAIENEEMSGLSKSKREKFIEFMTQYSEQFMSKSNEELQEIAQRNFIKAAKKYYSQEEVDAQIEFYSSDVGQRILDKQPKLMQEYMTSMMPEMMPVINKHQKELMPKVKEFMENLMK